MPKNHPEYERGFTDGFNAGTRFQAERTPPSDVEQLSELRRVAEAARKWFRWYKSSRSYPSDAPVSSLTVLQMLEAALTPKQLEKKGRQQ